MTILEAAEEYGTKIYQASKGDSILTITDRIYKSRDDIYFMILQRLNNRYDWDELPSGVEIKYIAKSYCDNIYELSDQEG